jgi:hypothetical protein
VTTAKGGNSGDVIAFFVLLDQYGEFSFWLHVRTLLRPILARKSQAIVETCGREGPQWVIGKK